MKINRALQGIWYKISGYQPEEVDKIINKATRVKGALKAQKARKREEKRLINLAKMGINGKDPGPYKGKRPIYPMKKTKQQKVTEQIERGFEVARRLNE